MTFAERRIIKMRIIINLTFMLLRVCWFVFKWAMKGIWFALKWTAKGCWFVIKFFFSSFKKGLFKPDGGIDLFFVAGMLIALLIAILVF